MQALPLRIRQLACRRGTRALFERLDADVAAGSLAWVRGANGRGKTSLLRIAAGLAAPEHGEVWRGRRVVYLGHAPALKDDLTAEESLAFLLRLHGGPAVAEAALDRFGMHALRRAPVRTLSQGQRRRVALARLAVEQSGDLWLLDEPYDALDAQGTACLDDLLSAHCRRGGAVVLTSHIPLGATLKASATDIDLDRHAVA